MAVSDTLDLDVERVDRIACHKCGYNIDVADGEPLSIVRCRACRTLLRVPAKLGEYLLTQRLGQGASGTTFVGRDIKLQRDVAIKVIKQTMGPEGSLVGGVLREARALAALNHRNVVDIYAVEVFRNQPFLVMELIDGPTLQEYVTEHGPLDEARALGVAIDMAEALKAAFDIGLVHGDVKPSNILLGSDTRTKIVDFGLVRTADAPTDEKVRGTPFYLSPEQSAGRPSDHRADIYALGATLFFALTGKRPAEGRTVKDVIEAKITRPAPDVRSVRSDLCIETAAVVKQMLRRDPGKRYETYEALLADLRTAAQKLTEAPPAPAAAPAPVRLPPPPAATAPVLLPPPTDATPNVQYDTGVPPQDASATPTYPDVTNPWGAAPGGSTAPGSRRPTRRRSGDDSILIVALIVSVIVLVGIVLVIVGLFKAQVL